jgi:hypothetical protein
MSMELSSGAANSARNPNPEDRFLAALHAEAGAAARVDLESIHRAFSIAFPHFDGSSSRRPKLAEMLESLAGEGRVRLPADRKRGWQNRPAPALPLKVTLVRPMVDVTTPFDHQSFPWAREMAFVAQLPVLHTPQDALCLHEFFKDGGRHSPIVPTKERSWQIFGEEKRLERLQCGQLFARGRLTLDLLRCRNVTQILAFSRSPTPVRAPVLIVENESTFHSFCRLNHQLAIYAGIVFGNGNTVLKSEEFLRDLGQAVEISAFAYFGDLDLRGLRIPYEVARLLRKFNLALSLEEALYTELLNLPLPLNPCPQPVDEELIAWLPADLRNRIRERLTTFGRIAQEALGWEKLCALYQANPDAEFSLGFSPRVS